MVGYLAYATAGHDRNKQYVIINEDEQYVWLSDGRLRPLDKPKKKKKKHIQIIKKRVQDDLYERLKNGGIIRDEELRKVIRDYNVKQSFMQECRMTISMLQPYCRFNTLFKILNSY